MSEELALALWNEIEAEYDRKEVEASLQEYKMKNNIELWSDELPE